MIFLINLMLARIVLAYTKNRLNSFTFYKKRKCSFKKNEIYGFIKFKRGLFSHKRKTLKNLLREHHFLNNKFDLNKRVENLSLEELLEIFRLINL